MLLSFTSTLCGFKCQLYAYINYMIKDWLGYLSGFSGGCCLGDCDR